MEQLKEFWQEEDGVGVVEIILILVILIGLVLMFKEEIGKIIDKAFRAIRDDSAKILQ